MGAPTGPPPPSAPRAGARRWRLRDLRGRSEPRESHPGPRRPAPERPLGPTSSWTASRAGRGRGRRGRTAPAERRRRRRPAQIRVGARLRRPAPPGPPPPGPPPAVATDAGPPAGKRAARGVAERVKRPHRGRQQQRARAPRQRAAIRARRPLSASSASDREHADGDQHGRQPASAGPGSRPRTASSVAHAGGDRQRTDDRARSRPPPISCAAPGTRRARRRTARAARRSRDGRSRSPTLNSTAVVSEPAADGDQPAAARVCAAQARREQQREAADGRKAEQPAGLAAERRVQQPQRSLVPPNMFPPCRPGRRPGRRRARGRCIRRSATARGCRPFPRSTAGQRRGRVPRAPARRRRRAPSHSRPRAAARTRGARQRPAGDIDSHAAAMPGTTVSATPIFVSKPSPSPHPREHQPARAARLEAHDPCTTSRRRAQHEQRVGVVVARDRHADRRQRER